MTRTKRNKCEDWTGSLTKNAVCHQFYSSCRTVASPRKMSKGWRLQRGGQVICIVKCANDIVLLPKEGTVVQDMIDRLFEIGRYYGMEMNVENTKVMRISKLPSQTQIMIGQKQLKNVNYLKCLGSMIINDARCKHEIKSKIAMAVAAFRKKKMKLFTSQLYLNLRKKQ